MSTSATATTNRDYIAEMRALIDKETADGPYNSRKVAERIVERLWAADPDLMDGWLQSQAVNFVWQSINDRDRSVRSHARATSRRDAFKRDTEAFGAGDRDTLVHWLNVPFVVRNGLRKRLTDMHADDLTFVAETYEARANDNRMTAAFLKVIARKVGNKAVGEVYTDERLSAAWRSLTGGGE